MRKCRPNIIQRNCACCGRELTIKQSETVGMNKDGHYFGTFRFGVGMWSKYKMEGLDEEGNMILKRCITRKRELWFRLVDLKRLLLHQYKDVEYWECDECYRKSDEPQSNFDLERADEDGTVYYKKDVGLKQK